jgi:Acetyltransferases
LTSPKITAFFPIHRRNSIRSIIMSPTIDLSLASAADAEAIASMSRDLIEYALSWRWTPARVAAQIRCPDAVVLVARDNKSLAGFAIMHFGEELAHLNLLTVKRSYQRRGLGGRLLKWLEASALVAGIAVIELEVRAQNQVAQAFYKSLGYEEVVLLPGYYEGKESAIRMVRILRMTYGLAAWLKRRHDLSLRF